MALECQKKRLVRKESLSEGVLFTAKQVVDQGFFFCSSASSPLPDSELSTIASAELSIWLNNHTIIVRDKCANTILV